MCDYSIPPRIIEASSNEVGVKSFRSDFGSSETFLYGDKTYYSASEALDEYIKHQNGSRLSRLSNDVIQVRILYWSSFGRFYVLTILQYHKWLNAIISNTVYILTLQTALWLYAYNTEEPFFKKLISSTFKDVY